MALRKILGMETEFGILHRRAGESNPIAASSVLINAYINSLDRSGTASPLPRVGWDFVDETPANDARGMSLLGRDGPRGGDPPRQRRADQRRPLLRRPRPPGAVHPGVRRPAVTVVLYDRAAEMILVESMRQANLNLPDGEEIVVYKNNSDRKGNSYGTHENYLMDRTTPVLPGGQPGHAALHLPADLHRCRQGRAPRPSACPPSRSPSS